MPKLGGAVGAKHSGKITVIECLIAELTSRGYHVGAIKEIVRIPTLDIPQTETDHRSYNSSKIKLISPN